MQYMKLNPEERDLVLASLTDMPAYLRGAFAGLSADRLRTPGVDGTPSPVEQVWHLADLEAEGYAIRIRRLVTESDPFLPDFDGGKVAAERNYRERSLDDGLAAFAAAREKNVEAFRALDDRTWRLSGTQAGVGRVSLCDIPGLMAQHDAAHKSEIDAWIASYSTQELDQAGRL